MSTPDTNTNTSGQQPAPEREIGSGFYDHATSRPARTDGVQSTPTNIEAEPGTSLYAKEQPVEIKFDVPEAVAKLREGNSKMFSAEAPYEQSITEDDFAEDDTPEELKTAVLGELRRMAHDHGASPADVGEVVAIAKEIAEEPPTPET